MAGADRVMKVAEAHKLDNPERLVWLPPDDVLRVLPVTAGTAVADIGAGTGYFALPLARAVGPTGRVFAVDLQPEMLALFAGKLKAKPERSSLELVCGSAAATTLSDTSCDLVFTANVWHEVPDHAAALREFRRILKPAGVLAIVDWRPDTEHPPGPPLDHRITRSSVAATLARNGWTVSEQGTVGMYSYFLLARPSR